MSMTLPVKNYQKGICLFVTYPKVDIIHFFRKKTIDILKFNYY